MMIKWNKTLMIILALLILAPPSANNKIIVVPQVDTIYDVTYADTPDGPVKLDVAWPVGEGLSCPIVVYFHGGGWTLGDKALFRHRMRVLAQSGYVVFNANYRQSPEARFPAAVNDVMGAVIFAKEKAPAYGGDPERVAVMGDSAGGHLAAMVALAWDDPYFKPSFPGNGETDASIKAAVLMYGGYRMDWIYNEDPRLWGFVSTRPMVFAFMGGTLQGKPEEYMKASPASYLDREDVPPMFILCGTADLGYPESLWLHERLEEKGVEHTAFFVLGAPHEFNYLEARKDFPFLRAILDFLDEKLENHQRT